MTAARAGELIERYQYDAAGNLTEAFWPASDEAAAETAGAREYAGTRVLTVGRVRYEHAAQGRVTLRQRKVASARPQNWHYQWDAHDRLVSVVTPYGTQWIYQYDPLGRRIGKTRLGPDRATAERVDFTWDGRQLAEQSTSDGRLTNWDYEPFTARPVAQTDRRVDPARPQDWFDTRFYAIVTDLVGTPTELIDPDGTVAWHQPTSLWGTPVGGGAAGTDCPLRFPGQYYDDEAALHYNVFRYYDPTSARYLSNDPVGLVGGDDPHQYVPNPLSGTDPFGLAFREHAWRTTLSRLTQLARQAPGAFSMSTAQLRFATDVLRSRPNLQVFRTLDGAGHGDFLIIDMSKPRQLVGWIAELKTTAGPHAGQQLLNAGRLAEEAGLRFFDAVSGTADELPKILSCGRGTWP